MSAALTTATGAYWSLAAEDELEAWLPKARAAAAELAKDVLERDAANQEPFAEVEILRKHDLINAIIPAEFGGGGAAFSTVFTIVRELARVDGSIAQLYAYHSVNVAAIGVFADEESTARWWRRIAEEQAVVGDAVNPTNPHLNLRTADGKLVLNGTKRFATGSGRSRRCHHRRRRACGLALSSSRCHSGTSLEPSAAASRIRRVRPLATSPGEIILSGSASTAS